ncbi:MAG: acyltransferase [Lachnospiraceae bacterium]|nr:acyltransferase [Lachnospiraceae bacterium]
MAEKKGRQLNYELLRILAMLMIVCLHYLSKGGFLGDPARARISATGYAAWFIEAFCLVAVNVYVLISGYFGAGTETKDVLRRPFNIWKQVIFYSVVIGVIAILTGIQQFDIYRIFTYIFPIVTEHYWFATSYIILCLFMPFLDRGVEMLDKKNLKKLLGAFLLIFCIAKTVIPMQLAWDKYGYDAFWFVTIYLTGAYIRRYGIPVINSRIKALALYLCSVLLIFVSFLVIRKVYFVTGSFGDFINYGYTYNHLLCYLGTIGLFMAFHECFGKKAGNQGNRLERIRKPIELVSGATFGVYLIHEHINIRYLWVDWFNCKAWIDASLAGFLGHMIVTVLTVYCVCTLIEIIRKQVMIRNKDER